VGGRGSEREVAWLRPKGSLGAVPNGLPAWQFSAMSVDGWLTESLASLAHSQD
jgi:hypothetical protein